MRQRSFRAALATLLVILLVAPSFALAATTAPGSLDPKALGGKPLAIPGTGLSEEEKVVHLLNRIGFGPRPGDIDRVKEIGIAAYIEQQLQPESIRDDDVEQRLAGLDTLQMTSTQLLAAYPPPQLLRGIERRLSAQRGMDPEATGSLFPELQRRRDRQAHDQQPTGEMDAADMSPPERRRRGQDRMQRAMNSPARIVIELSQAKLTRAVYSERQLQEVMTDFWFNHFNVFIGKNADRWLTTSYEYEAIRPHVLGSFRDLLGATARHPAMLFYLDNWQSADPKADIDQRELRLHYYAALRRQGRYPGDLMLEVLRQRGVDTAQAEQRIERQIRRFETASNGRTARRGRLGRQRRGQQQEQQQRPRGLNENYARELLELHTLGVDGGYTQKDVIEIARCFTGWTMLPLQLGPEFLYINQMHDKGTKVVLDHTIRNAGQRDAEQVLDILARHPSTARFISTKLAQRFVSDDPSATLVEKMAGTFAETDGDIRAVLRTMFASEEFWSPDAVGAKVKTPFEFVVSAARATGAELGQRPPGLVMALRELGQPLYAAQPPTGYKETADAWVSTGGLLARMKVALGLATNRLPGVRSQLSPDWVGARTRDEMVSRLAQDVVGRPVSENTRAALTAELEKAGAEIAAGGRHVETRLALGWLLASPEFQRQ
jgi:uncharacterized protein (DUF1800 family)